MAGRFDAAWTHIDAKTGGLLTGWTVRRQLIATCWFSMGVRWWEGRFDAVECVMLLALAELLLDNERRDARRRARKR